MNSPKPEPVRSHLRAAAIALALLAALVGAGLERARWIERQYGPAAVANSANVKDLGIVWQRQCFARPNLLPLYGSSELIKKAPNKASQFFATYPSGFAISPVGRASCTSLILLEKLAAAGSDARGRKVAICISPSWFLVKGANRGGFDGNFSTMQASELFFGAPLSWRLKHSIARRMLRYPEVFEKAPVLSIAVSGLASDRWRDRALYFAALPLGSLQNFIYRLQDHFELAMYLREEHRHGHTPQPRASALDWDRLLATARPMVKPLPEEVPDSRLPHYAGDGVFLNAMQRSVEWGDLELLLRAVRELDLDPLLVSMPIEYGHFERMGIAAQSVDAYASRLHTFAARYQVPVVDFVELGEDPQFFADHFGHPSAKGWIYLDRALDDFYHGRAVRGGESISAADAAPLSNPLTDRPRLPRSGPSSEIPGT